MDKIVEYFTGDPFRILYLLGGTGGIWFWIGQWRDRIRLKVRIIKEGHFISEHLDEESYLQCEITSLQPTVIIEAYTPKREFQRYEGKIRELERDLPLHRQKQFTVEFNAGDVYNFLLFRKISFRLTRGFAKSLRVKSAGQKNIPACRFMYELTCFKWFGKYNEPKP